MTEPDDEEPRTYEPGTWRVVIRDCKHRIIGYATRIPFALVLKRIEERQDGISPK